MKNSIPKAFSFRRSFLLPLALCICFLIYLLLLLLLCIPRIIDHDPIRRELTRRTSQFLSMPLKTSEVRLTFFPRPFLQIQNLQLRPSKALAVQVESLQVFPSWKDLFLGKARIQELRVKGPAFELQSGDRAHVPLPDAQALQAVLQRLSKIEKTSIEDGRLRIESRETTLLSCSGIQAQARGLPLLKLQVKGRSAQAKRFSVQFSGDPESLDFQGRLKLANLQLQEIAKFFPPGYQDLGSSRVNLKAELKIASGNILESAFQANAPDWKLKGRRHDLLVIDPALQGRLHLSPESTRIFISDLHLENPEIQLSGEFGWEFASNTINCRVQASNFQIKALKKAWLSVGESQTLRKILSIVPGGQVQELALSTSGRSLSELGDNFRLQGGLDKGTVIVPAPRLHLTDVRGSVLYEDGVLRCRQAGARMGGAEARNGEFVLGLKAMADPFLLRTEIEGSFEALPAVLRKTVHSESFLHELESFSEISGQGKGTLRIEKETRGWTVKAGLERGFLKAKMDRLPFPVRIGAGTVHWNSSQTKLHLEKLKASSSSCQSISAVVQADRKNPFEIETSEAVLEVQELLPWLRSPSSGFSSLPTKWRPGGANLPAIQADPVGKVFVETGRLQGKLQDSENWDFRVKGSVQELRLHSKALPSPLQVKSGAFQAESGQAKLALKDWKIHCLDGSAGLSLVLEAAKDETALVEFIFSQGRLRPEILRVLHTRLPLPEDIELKGPIAIKQGSLQLRNGRIFELQFGLEASETALDINIRLPGDQQARYHFEVVDRFSKARIEIEQTAKNLFETSFSGYLDQRSIHNICRTQTYFMGSALGHFSLQVQPNPFHIKSALGKIQLNDLFLPIPGAQQRLGIENLEIKADPKQLRIQKGQMIWGTSAVNLSGTIDTAFQYNRVDLHCKAGNIAWDGIRSAFFAQKSKESTKDTRIADRLRKIRGSLNIKADTFQLDRFSWQPLQIELKFEKNRITLSSSAQSSLCSIRTPGTLSIEDGTIRLQARPEIAGRDLEDILSCFHGTKQQLTGRCSLTGNLQSRGSDWEGLKNAFQGSLHLSAENGRIYKATLLSKVLQLLNTTEIFFGSIPDLEKEGFAYHTLKMDCVLEDSILKIESGFLNAQSMAIEFIGRFDPRSTELELLIAVAPLKTVDRLLAKIPLIKGLTGNHLVSIPLKVSGTLDKHRITPIPPHRLGQNFLDMLKRTLKAPVAIIQPLLENNQEIRTLDEESSGR